MTLSLITSIVLSDSLYIHSKSGIGWTALPSLPLPFTSLIYYYTFSKVSESPLKRAFHVSVHNETCSKCLSSRAFRVRADGNLYIRACAAMNQRHVGC